MNLENYKIFYWTDKQLKKSFSENTLNKYYKIIAYLYQNGYYFNCEDEDEEEPPESGRIVLSEKEIDEALGQDETSDIQIKKVEIYQAAPPDLNQKTNAEDQSTPSGKINGNEVNNNNATEYDENANKVNDYNSEPNAEEKRADMSGNSTDRPPGHRKIIKRLCCQCHDR